MNEEIIVRKATENDLEILYVFEQGVIAAERPFDTTLKKDLINYYDLPEMIKAAHVELLVGELQGKIIASGYARIEDAKPYLKNARHAYLGFMYVEPTHRGKGVNNKIIGALKQWIKSKDITELRLDVYFGNESAIKAYEKMGFTKHMIEMRFNVEQD